MLTVNFGDRMPKRFLPSDLPSKGFAWNAPRYAGEITNHL